jgi:hypothetical protein
MNSLNKTARIAGFLYLLVVIAGPFTLIYVPGKLFVPGDATATANNILANEWLFRINIIVSIVSQLIFMSVVLTLYQLLKDVNRKLATIMVILIFIDVPLAFLSIANQVATLSFVRGAEFLAVFDKPQRDALATLLINIDRQGIYVSEIFWGLWLIPLGLLIFRSGFLPRFVGIWLLFNGLAYIVMSFNGLLVPQHYGIVQQIAFPALLGEVALMLWLLIMGVKEKTVVETVSTG